jgi:hypothetical protein
LTVADGLPVPVIMLLAPRTTSTRSNSTVSRSPNWMPQISGRPTPSTWKLVMSKPREL